MKELIHELIIIATSVGTLICRELIVLLKKYITTPKNIRANKKNYKTWRKISKIK